MAWLMAFGVALGASSGLAAEAKVETLLGQAEAAHKRGEHSEALALASQAIKVASTNPLCYYIRGRIYADQHEPTNAIADFDQALKLEPKTAVVYQVRGAERFKLGQFKESIADFDRFIALVPKQEPYHWQRGIAYYYAGRYEEGRKQFELHQTVNSNDVENAVWHFLCVARSQGVEKARAALIPIQGDQRVPMMKIHELFANKAKPEDVLAAAQAKAESPALVNQQLFYAHLYLGLYFEATGNEKQAREHIMKAANEYSQDHYMGDVARVHAKLFR